MRIGPTMKKMIRTVMPRTLEHRIRVALNSTVAEGWERNARMYKGGKGEHLGDDWSEGEGIALGVSAE